MTPDNSARPVAEAPLIVPRPVHMRTSASSSQPAAKRISNQPVNVTLNGFAAISDYSPIRSPLRSRTLTTQSSLISPLPRSPLLFGNLVNNRVERAQVTNALDSRLIGYLVEYLSYIHNLCSICVLLYACYENHSEFQCPHVINLCCLTCFGPRDDHSDDLIDSTCPYVNEEIPRGFCIACGLPPVAGAENIRLHPQVSISGNELELNLGARCNSGARGKILPVLYVMYYQGSELIPDSNIPFTSWRNSLISSNGHIGLIVTIYRRHLQQLSQSQQSLN